MNLNKFFFNKINIYKTITKINSFFKLFNTKTIITKLYPFNIKIFIILNLIEIFFYTLFTNLLEFLFFIQSIIYKFYFTNLTFLDLSSIFSLTNFQYQCKFILIFVLIVTYIIDFIIIFKTQVMQFIDLELIKILISFNNFLDKSQLLIQIQSLIYFFNIYNIIFIYFTFKIKLKLILLIRLIKKEIYTNFLLKIKIIIINLKIHFNNVISYILILLNLHFYMFKIILQYYYYNFNIYINLNIFFNFKSYPNLHLYLKLKLELQLQLNLQLKKLTYYLHYFFDSLSLWRKNKYLNFYKLIFIKFSFIYNNFLFKYFIKSLIIYLIFTFIFFFFKLSLINQTIFLNFPFVENVISLMMFKLKLPLSLLLSLLLTDENKIYITFTLLFSFTKFEYTLLLKNFFTDLQLLIVIEQFINGCLIEINILEYLIYYIIILLSILIFMFYIDIGFFLFLLPLKNLIIYNYYRTKIVLSVVPMTVGLVLSANNEETSLNSEQDTNSKSESESESKSQSESESESSNNNIVPYNENKGWDLSLENLKFKDLSRANQIEYISNLMLLKGLDINPFLMDYFITSILNNTSGNRNDVYNFLNTNLNSILNSRRNTQLNNNSFFRVRPFLLNNSNTSLFPNELPFKSDDTFDYEWQELSDSIEEAKNSYASEFSNTNTNTNTNTNINTNTNSQLINKS